MKIYAISYEVNSFTKMGKTDKRSNVYTEDAVGEFIQAAKDLKNMQLVSNVKVFSGTLNEIDMNKVFNPF